MEEDDPTPRALPRWVELEYKVSTIPLPRVSGTYHDNDLPTLDSLPLLMNPMNARPWDVRVSHAHPLPTTLLDNTRNDIAHAHACRSRRVCGLYTSVACG